MLAFSKLTKSQAFYLFSFGIVFIIYLISYIISPFTSNDTPFYTLIGRSILQDHVLPYKYIFDHKPFFSFVLYGVWDALMPIKTGMFTLLALCCAAGAATVASSIWKTNRFLVFFILITTGAAFKMLSGNTGVLQIFFQILVLYLLQYPSFSRIILSGVITAFAVNINYLTAECLFLPIIFSLYKNKKITFNIFFFIFGVFSGLFILFSPYLYSDPLALIEYFQQQKQFLAAYSPSFTTRLFTVIKLFCYVLFFIPVLYVWVQQNIFQKQERIGPNSILLGLWFVSGLIASCISGYPFEYYYILWFFPITIMIAQIIKKPEKNFKWFFMPIAILTLFSVVDSTINNIIKYRNIHAIDYVKMASLTKGGSVLNIRALQTHFYMADLKNFDPYLFKEHIDIAFGSRAAAHYMHDLEQKPLSVLLPYQGCEIGAVEATVCHYLHENYQKIYEVKIVKLSGKIDHFSFELYKRKSGA